MFSDIHKFYSKVIEELDTAGKAELQAVVSDVKSYVQQAETDAAKQVAGASPDVQAAVQRALQLAEQAIMAALAAHGL